MISLRIAGVAVFCLLCSGCLTARRTWEQVSPLYLGKWRYSEQVYSGMDYERLWEGIMSVVDIGLDQWSFEELDKEDGRLESEWLRTGNLRRKLEMRIDRTMDEEDNPGYLISLRVLRQRTREPYSPLHSRYTWRHYGQDGNMEALILARFQDEFREYRRKDSADS